MEKTTGETINKRDFFLFISINACALQMNQKRMCAQLTLQVMRNEMNISRFPAEWIKGFWCRWDLEHNLILLLS